MEPKKILSLQVTFNLLQQISEPLFNFASKTYKVEADYE